MNFVRETLCLAYVALFWFLACGRGWAAEETRWPEVRLTPEDRILVLAPHPDDEVLGCGGILQKMVMMGLPVRVVFLTYGDENEWSFMVYRKRPVLTPGGTRRMGEVRHDEAIGAEKVFHVAPDDLKFLGYPDFGTFHIWCTHWGNQLPFRSLLTRASAVPYQDALRPGALYRGDEVLEDVKSVLREFRPTKVFVSHPADDNGDHRALYLFTRVALWNLENEMHCALYPYLIHSKHWPRPYGYRPQQTLEPPPLVPPIAWQVYHLTPDQIIGKYQALQMHRTQYQSESSHLLPLVRTNELFGDYPVIALRTLTSDEVLQLQRQEKDLRIPEELTDSERVAFIGLEQQFVRVEHDDLVITVKLSRPLARGVEMSLYAFGYRTDRSFAKMPKLHAKLGEFAYAIYDQNRKLPAGALQVRRQFRQITFRIPLATMDHPHRILTGARTYLGELPLDWSPWRVLELQDSPLSSQPVYPALREIRPVK